MKSLQQYLTEEKHITHINFSKLTNEGDSNILNDIEKSDLGMMISPQEEEFGYQWMDIYWDKNLIEFFMPNTLSNSGPTGFKIKLKISDKGISRWYGGSPFIQSDFKVYQVPGSLVKLNIDSSKFQTQLCELVCMIMNRQPEPLW